MKSTEKSLVYAGVLLLGLMGCFDTARAQNNTLTANPTQLTFNTQQGVTPTPQTVLVSYSGGAASVTVSTFSNNNWLVATPSSGTTPLSVSISIGPGAPTTGSDVGFINVTGPGPTFLTIAVTLNTNSSGASSPLTASPNSLSFNFPANSTIPSSQPVTVSSNNAGVTTFTATAVTNGGGNWLTVSPQAGNLPGSFQATVNPASLGAGTFNGAIAINAPGTTGISLPVLVTVAGTPALDVSPAQLSFAFQLSAGAPAAQTLTLTSSTGSNISFSAAPKTSTCGNNWLVVSPTQGATPGTLSVQINTSGLTAGPCSGEIDISAPNASNPAVTVAVNLLVSTNPLLLVPSSGPTFNYQIGSTIPAAQNVQITSSSTALNFTVAAAPVSGGPNFLVVTPTSGTTPQAVNLAINAAIVGSLGPGTYSENVTITSAGAGNSPQSFPVTLVVASNAVLNATVSSLNFNYQVGKAVPTNQTFTVSSTGAPLNYQVAANTTSCSGFLAATPANGSTFGSQNQVVVSVNTAGLTTSQSCSGNVTLNVPGSGTPPLVIPVTLNVSTTALLNVGQSGITVSTVVGAASSVQQVSVTSTDTSAPLPFTATAATNPIGLTWLSVAPNSGNTPNNLQVTINPINLGVGSYTGTITVSSTAPNVPAQTINVTLNIVASSATATPTSLTFTESVGGAAPPSQAVQIGGVPAGATIGVISTMLNGSGWLTATAAATTVTVTANGTLLPQGSYAGVVTVIVPGAGNSPLYVPVTLNVGAAPTLAVSPATVNFTAQFGSTTASSQTVQVTSTGGSIPFTAAFAAKTGGAFVTVTPASGNTTGTLTLALNTAVVSSLAAGTYSGTVTVSSPNIAGGNQTVTVNLTVLPAATPIIQSLSNGASLQPVSSVSPGEIITFKGLNLGPATPPEGIQWQKTAGGTVPTTLGGVTVTFNNVAAPLLYVSETQINAIVPYEMGSFSTATVVVQFSGSTSANFQVQIVPTAPAIFSLSQGGSGQGAILNQDFSVNGDAKPAAKGSIVQIFATGEGSLVPAGATGCITGAVPPFAAPVAKPVTVTIGGQSADISYAGEAPTLVCGALQVNAKVPANIGSGPQSMVLTVGTNTNTGQSITVTVQ
ncbi:MAG: hypothetical protein LAP38_19625 [Acidobacteriia bacterium]|nr:hypothetical protein [Terriglobia bacterium]